MRTSTPRMAAVCRAVSTPSSGTKYGEAIQSFRRAEFAASATTSCHESAGSAGPVGMIAATWSACFRTGVPVQFRHLVRRPEPVFQKHQLDRLHHRSAHFQVSVPPLAEALVAPEIFIAHVQSADERHLAIAHHDLAVIAEIQLKPRPPIAVDAERMALDSSRPEFLQVAPRQLVRADFIKQEIHLHSGLRPLDERLLETRAELCRSSR